MIYQRCPIFPCTLLKYRRNCMRNSKWPCPSRIPIFQVLSSNHMISGLLYTYIHFLIALAGTSSHFHWIHPKFCWGGNHWISCHVDLFLVFLFMYRMLVIFIYLPTLAGCTWSSLLPKLWIDHSYVWYFIIFYNSYLYLVDVWIVREFILHIIELDDGKIYRKALYLMVKTHGFPVDFPLNQSIDHSSGATGFIPFWSAGSHWFVPGFQVEWMLQVCRPSL